MYVQNLIQSTNILNVHQNLQGIDCQS